MIYSTGKTKAVRWSCLQFAVEVAPEVNNHFEDFDAEMIYSAVSSSNELEASVAGDRQGLPWPSVEVAEEVVVSPIDCKGIQEMSVNVIK